jgi:probable rRNA maturation factor
MVTLQNEQSLNIPTQASLESWADAAAPGKALTLRFTDKAESQALTKQFRQQDKPTNVLSFPAEAIPGIEIDYLGDILICVSIVESEAAEQGKNLEAHFAHMTIHGILHLLGFDHVNASDADTMEALEIKLLAQFAYPNPYKAQ